MIPHRPVVLKLARSNLCLPDVQNHQAATLEEDALFLDAIHNKAFNKPAAIGCKKADDVRFDLWPEALSLVLNLAQHANAAILSTSHARKVNCNPHGFTSEICFSMESRKCCEDDSACRMEEFTKQADEFLKFMATCLTQVIREQSPRQRCSRFSSSCWQTHQTLLATGRPQFLSDLAQNHSPCPWYCHTPITPITLLKRSRYSSVIVPLLSPSG